MLGVQVRLQSSSIATGFNGMTANVDSIYSMGIMLSMLQSAAVARQKWKFSSLMTPMLLTRGKILTTFSIIHYITANKPEGYF